MSEGLEGDVYMQSIILCCCFLLYISAEKHGVGGG